SVLEGHTNGVVDLSFTPAGDLLLSQAWDTTTRVWDPVSGTCSATIPASAMWIDASGRRIAARIGDAEGNRTTLALWSLEEGRESRGLHHGTIGNRPDPAASDGPVAMDFSPDSRLLASSGVDGTRLWKAASGNEVAHLRDPAGGSVEFSPD